MALCVRVCARAQVSLPHPESAAATNTSEVGVGRLLPAFTDL